MTSIRVKLLGFGLLAAVLGSSAQAKVLSCRIRTEPDATRSFGIGFRYEGIVCRDAKKRLFYGTGLGLSLGLAVHDKGNPKKLIHPFEIPGEVIAGWRGLFLCSFAKRKKFLAEGGILYLANATLGLKVGGEVGVGFSGSALGACVRLSGGVSYRGVTVDFQRLDLIPVDTIGEESSIETLSPNFF